jgi:LysR family transcriptional regulator, nitrogen assimilation regulatory protein
MTGLKLASIVKTMTESLRQIRLFVAAYEEGSFTAAAHRENATQSGVSQHIHKLEARFGAALFSRDTGAIHPTPAGDLYYRYCIEILRVHEASRNEMKRFGSGLSGEIVVGLMPTMTRSVLGPTLATFVKHNPNAQVRIAEGFSALLTERVRAGEYAFAIVPAFQGAPGLNARPFHSTPEVLVSRRTSRRAHMTPVRLKDVGPLNLLLPSPPNTRRRTLDTYLASNGVRVRQVLEIDSMFGALDLIANSDWVSIFPGIMMASDIDRDLFTINVIVEPQLILDLALIEPMRQPMGPLAQTFLKLLEDETARIGARLATSPESVPADARPIGEMRAESRAERAARGGDSWTRPERARAVKPSVAAGAVRHAKRGTEAPA